MKTSNKIKESLSGFSGCGIVGAMALNDKRGREILNNINTKRMLDAIKHRGPEAEGEVKTDLIFLGHRRLSILDLSESGNQPMTRDHLTIISNGEVYNFEEIKKELEKDGFVFTSKTDTEVILRAYQKWGVNGLHRFNGMFALAIWDKKKECLFLARDRAGVKPLYYYKDDNILIFGSEIDALLGSNYIQREIDYNEVFKQILVNSLYQIDISKTPVKGINSLLPGHYITLNTKGEFHIRKYWDLPETDYEGKRSVDLLAEELKTLMEDSVRLRLVSDVRVSAFLSGGMDSSVINVLAGNLVKNYKLTGVTVTYEGGGKDFYTGKKDEDLEYSIIAAEALKDKLIHRVIGVKPGEVNLDSIDGIMDLASFPDDIRLFTISKNYNVIKNEGFKVVLNGQGADEIMGGYVFTPFFKNTNFDVLLPEEQQPKEALIRHSFPYMAIPGKETLLPELMQLKDDIYEEMHQYFHSFEGNLLEKAHRFLMKTELQKVLKMEDFLSMRWSVECRLPFLDYRIMEWAFKVPFHLHLDKKRELGKILLRNAAKDYLPKKILDRPKQTFPTPGEEHIIVRLKEIYRKNHKEIQESDFLNRIYKRDILKAEYPGLSSRELWLLLVLWRWEHKLKFISHG